MTADTQRSPICVQDTFHFSTYYWKEFEGNNGETSDDESTTPVFKPTPVQKDTIKLKFYAQGKLKNEEGVLNLVSIDNLCLLLLMGATHWIDSRTLYTHTLSLCHALSHGRRLGADSFWKME